MMPVESMTTATTAKPLPQHGGKYADHEFVKVASKVIKGVERAPYNKFETILVNYDKMKEIKGKRNLTKSEQRIYDKADKLIQKEFDAMFKKADTMLDQLDRKTSVQKGGGVLGKIFGKKGVATSNPTANNQTGADDAAIKRMNKYSTGSETGVPPPPPAAKKEVPTSDATAPAAVDAAAAGEKSSPAADAAQENPANDAAAQENPANDAAAKERAAKELAAAESQQQQQPPAQQPVHPREGEDNTPAAATPAAAAVAPAATPKASESDNETSYMDSNRPYRWIIGLLTGIWYWIKSLFTGAFSDKFEQLRKEFSADEIFKKFGNDVNKMDKVTGEFKEHAEKLQRLVASGIGGAASASIDMILNAFSMSPVFGTTILVWRMFQNMLMIMGSSLSVQAANNKFSTNVATAVDPKSAKDPPNSGGGKAKNNVTKRIKTDIRQLNRSLKRYMHFPHRHRHRQQGTTTTMSGSGAGAGSGYSYT